MKSQEYRKKFGNWYGSKALQQYLMKGCQENGWYFLSGEFQQQPHFSTLGKYLSSLLPILFDWLNGYRLFYYTYNLLDKCDSFQHVLFVHISPIIQITGISLPELYAACGSLLFPTAHFCLDQFLEKYDISPNWFNSC